MNKPLLSICIPTYNRAPYLKELLDSIVCQFNDLEVYEQVEIVISDNASEDNTTEIVSEYQKKYKNIRYFRNDENVGGEKNFINVSELSNGKYLWAFSDDDLQINNALKLIIKEIKTNYPDVVISNLNSFFGKLEKITYNLFKINQDYFFVNRKDFFKYLNKKTFVNLDFYTTFMSNWILKKDVFNNYRYILDKFNGPLDLFSIQSIIFYSDAQISVEIISTPTLFMRGDNESWGSKDKIKHYFYRSKLWKHHYKNIIDLNKKEIPFLFSLKIKIKNFLEIKGLLDYLFVTLLKKIYLYNFVKFFYYRLKTLRSNLKVK